MVPIGFGCFLLPILLFRCEASTALSPCDNSLLNATVFLLDDSPTPNLSVGVVIVPGLRSST